MCPRRSTEAAEAAPRARLFLALWPGPALRRGLLEHREQWVWAPAASLVSPDDLHLTLHFLGSMPRARVPELTEGLAVPFSPFELRLTQPGLWPHGVAVLQAARVPDRLQALHSALNDALARLGLPTELRVFRPHVTLARHAGASIVPAEPAALRWRATGYVLVESRPAARPRYAVLHRYA